MENSTKASLNIMNFIVISDTHNHHERISLQDGDILLHLGDAADRGDIFHIKSFAK